MIRTERIPRFARLLVILSNNQVAVMEEIGVFVANDRIRLHTTHSCRLNLIDALLPIHDNSGQINLLHGHFPLIFNLNKPGSHAYRLSYSKGTGHMPVDLA